MTVRLTPIGTAPTLVRAANTERIEIEMNAKRAILIQCQLLAQKLEKSEDIGVAGDLMYARNAPGKIERKEGRQDLVVLEGNKVEN